VAINDVAVLEDVKPVHHSTKVLVRVLNQPTSRDLPEVLGWNFVELFDTPTHVRFRSGLALAATHSHRMCCGITVTSLVDDQMALCELAAGAANLVGVTATGTAGLVAVMSAAVVVAAVTDNA
jgi:hypothetical protein